MCVIGPDARYLLRVKTTWGFTEIYVIANFILKKIKHDA